VESRQFRPNPRDFAFIWTGYFLTTFGGIITNFIINWKISFEPGSPAIMSDINFIYLISSIIGLLFLGVFIDVLNRRNLLISLYIVKIIFTMIMIPILTAGSIHIISLKIIIFLSSMIQALIFPTFFAIIPTMISQRNIGRVNGFNYLILSVSQIFGSYVASLILSSVNVGISLWIDIILITLSLIPLFFVKVPSVKEFELNFKDTLINRYANGFKSYLKFPSVTFIIIIYLIFTFLNHSFDAYFPYFIIFYHSSQLINYAILSSILSIGIIIGGIVCSVVKYWNPPILLFFISIVVLFSMNFLIVISPFQDYNSMAQGLFSKGFFQILVLTIFSSILQINIPKRNLGYVYALFLTFSNLIIFGVLNYIYPILSIIIDVRTLLLISAAFGALIVIFLYFILRLQKLKSEDYILVESPKD
jgi:MFS family permease